MRYSSFCYPPEAYSSTLVGFSCQLHLRKLTKLYQSHGARVNCVLSFGKLRSLSQPFLRSHHVTTDSKSSNPGPYFRFYPSFKISGHTTHTELSDTVCLYTTQQLNATPNYAYSRKKFQFSVNFLAPRYRIFGHQFVNLLIVTLFFLSGERGEPCAVVSTRQERCHVFPPAVIPLV